MRSDPRGKKTAVVLLPLITVLVIAGWASACSNRTYTLTANPTPYVRDDPTEYYLYLPAAYQPDREWPLFVGIHGFGGSGRSCLSLWQEYAEAEGFILLCPSLADENGGWYLYEGEKILKEIIQRVRQECHTQKRVFLVGFSAGAEFVQGFAFDLPQYVAAVSVLSSGNYYEPRKRAKDIPFLVVIGDQDYPASLKGANLFSEMLQNDGFAVDLHVLPGVTHRVSPQAKELTLAFFRQVFGR